MLSRVYWSLVSGLGYEISSTSQAYLICSLAAPACGLASRKHMPHSR